MIFLKQLAVAACVHVLVIYICRFVLLRGGGGSSSGDAERPLRCFRIRVAVGILYLSMSAILFGLFVSVMPPWGAVAVWGMALAAVELGYAFFFPYTCYHVGGDDDDDDDNIPITHI
uniref:Uncharacterized protein n=1 Tax=Oryza punctata TaxID=4537 RepID=A0A0E0MGN9_ORYPU